MDDYKKRQRLEAYAVSILVISILLIAYSCSLQMNANANIIEKQRPCHECHSTPPAKIKTYAQYKRYHQNPGKYERELRKEMEAEIARVMGGKQQ